VFDAFKHLQEWPTGFPRLIQHGKTNHFYYYIMERLGKSLKQAHSECKSRKMEIGTLIKISLQLIDRLEVMHK
jgi:hypothetical protein